MAIQTRTLFIERKKHSDGSERYRILPYFLVQDSNIGAAFEIIPAEYFQQRSGGPSGDIEDRDEEANKITDVRFVADEGELRGQYKSTHVYDPYVRDIRDAPPAGIVVSP